MKLSEGELEILKTLPVVTRRRVAALAAFGLLDQQIADVQLLTVEQVIVCKKCDEYIEAYAKSVNERMQMQMDLAEGWDAVEERALSQVYQTLEYNRNPQFALLAARIANQAKRSQSQGQDQRVIDNAPVNNVITLNLNKVYINNVQKSEIPIVNQEKRALADIPKKRFDVPNPKQVENLLSPQKKLENQNTFKDAFEEAGVVVSEFADE